MRKLVVVGGSAGCIEALCRILEDLPADFPAPILERRYHEDAAAEDMRLLKEIPARL
jgi:chemotaxis response regulator CheB